MSKHNGAAKKRRGNKKYYLVKVPKFIANAWWDPEKFPAQSNLGTLQYMGAAKKKPKVGMAPKALMKLTVNVNDPWDSSKPRYNATESGMNHVEAPLKIPRALNVTEKKLRSKAKFKHDRYQDAEEEKLLVFSEKTLPALNKALEVTTKNGDDAKAVILNIYEQSGKQMCEVQYHDGVTERDVELSRVKWTRKCKLVRYVDRNLEANPEMNREYREFLKTRFKKDSSRKSVHIGRKSSIFDVKDKKRRRDLIERKLEISRKKQRMINEGPKLKRVRRDQDVYRKRIFKAFDQKAYLSRDELCGWCGDSTGASPWAFIKETVGQLCVYHNVGNHQKTYSLKDDYKLATDAAS